MRSTSITCPWSGEINGMITSWSRRSALCMLSGNNNSKKKLPIIFYYGFLFVYYIIIKHLNLN
jgi:hypothetical protein